MQLIYIYEDLLNSDTFPLDTFIILNVIKQLVRIYSENGLLYCTFPRLKIC